MPRNMPSTLVSKVGAHRLDRSPRAPACRSEPTPALLMSTFGCPNALTQAARPAAQASSLRTSSVSKRSVVAVVAASAAASSVARRLDVDGEHLRPLGDEQPRRRRADSGRRARDDRDLAVEPSCHARFSLSPKTVSAGAGGLALSWPLAESAEDRVAERQPAGDELDRDDRQQQRAGDQLDERRRAAARRKPGADDRQHGDAQRDVEAPCRARRRG